MKLIVMRNNKDNTKHNLDSTIFQAIALLGVPVEATELAIELDLAVAIVRNCLNKLVDEGLLAEEFGRYYLAEQPAEEEQKREEEDMGTVVCLEAKREELSVYALRRQEKIIETAEQAEQAGKKAIFAKGQALKTIRDDRLYRNSYDTFDQYCKARLGFAKDYCNRIISAFNIFENIRSVYSCMETNIKQNDAHGHQTNIKQNDAHGHQTNIKQNDAHGTQSNTEAIQIVLPSSERQIRPLAKLQIPLQFQIWREAVELTNGKPTGKVVNQLVKDFLRAEQDELDEDFSLSLNQARLRSGDVVRIDAQDNPQLKPFHGSWGIVDDHYEHPYYKVATWFGTTSTVRKRQAKEINCDRELAKSICSKLNKLRLILEAEQPADPFAWIILKTIGRLHESEITKSTEDLLDAFIDRKQKC